MPTYIVSLDEMLRVAKPSDGRTKRAFYWEAASGFVVEYPATNMDGAFTGVVLRCELPYEGLAAEVVRYNPAAKESDVDNVVLAFERIFLGQWFRKVEGEYRADGGVALVSTRMRE